MFRRKSYVWEILFMSDHEFHKTEWKVFWT